MYLAEIYKTKFKGTFSRKPGDTLAGIALTTHILSVMMLWGEYDLVSFKDLLVVFINLFLFRFAFWTWVYYSVSVVIILSSIFAIYKVYTSV
jgi:hypothetical protein